MKERVKSVKTGLFALFRRKQTVEQQAARADKAAAKAAMPRKKRRWVKAAAIGLAAAVALGGGGWFALNQLTPAAAAEDDGGYSTALVERRTITSTITGSGTLQAADSYTVTTLLEGTILTADFEEGDEVQEGDVLYTIDSSDAASSLEQAQISLDQAQRNYSDAVAALDDLTVRADIAGTVVSLDVEAGDEVMAGEQIATLRNSSVMTITVPFPADDAEGFFVGQGATVTLDSTFETVSGTVTKVGGATEVLTGNVIVRQVTIQVSNPGGISTSQSASAEVGGVGSSSGGTFAYGGESVVTAAVSGTVSALSVSEGDTVRQGAALAVLTSESLEDQVQSASESLRNQEIAYENQTSQLDDYTITAPITGTIVDKNYNAGEISESSQTLCTIYDLSYLTMTLSVDELDIADIAVGQTVTVTADAVEGVSYTGTVTKVSVAGASSGSATTYPVTIRIDETDGLLPGMSVDATITLNSAEDVLAIPAAAVNRGNTVLLTADSPSAAGGSQTEAGYVSVEVTAGVSDDSYIEITSGLQEGDTVAYIPTTSSGNGFSMMPGGMGGGPGGGPGGGF